VGKHFREEMEMALEQALHNAGPVFLMRIQTLLVSQRRAIQAMGA
jgi:hypothetical protein